MRKIIYIIFILLSVIAFSSCTVHLYDYERVAQTNKILLKVIPEDAIVLLNGHMIGEAYEFSTWQSALQLSSKDNELVIKKSGYVEQAVNLHDYSGREFIVRVELRQDNKFKPKKIVIRKKELKKKDEGVPVKPKPIKPIAEKSNTIIEKTTVSLSVEPADSAIYINNKFWGISPKTGKIGDMFFKKGKYIFEVVKPGYTTIKKILNITGKRNKINLKLVLSKK